MKTYNLPPIGSRILVMALVGLGAARLSAQSLVPTDGLVGYWRGENNAQDSSSLHNDGSYAGDYTSGVAGMAFGSLNGAYVSIPDNAAYAFVDAMSVSFWFKGIDEGPTVFLGQDDGAGGYNKWFVDYNYVSGSRFEFHLNGASYAFLPADPVSFDAGQWNHFAVVKSGDAYSFYLNGVFAGVQNFSGAFSDPSTSLNFGFLEVDFGGRTLGYRGSLDEIALYSRALSADEVSSIASLGAVPEPSVYAMTAGVAALLFARWRRRETHLKVIVT